jgi:hypothetical protein
MRLPLWQAAPTLGVVRVDVHPFQHVRLRKDWAIIFASDHAPVLIMCSERSAEGRRDGTALTAFVVLSGGLVVLNVGFQLSHVAMEESFGFQLS